MRRATIIGIAIVLVAGVALTLIAKPELLSHVGIGRDTARLRQLSRSFLEDVQFKDFRKAATYHRPEEQKTVDIPYLLERLFAIKPEQLDIMEYEILFAKIDSTDLRGRVKARLKIKDLLRKKLVDRQLMLYYHRDTPTSPWRMKLESSLRGLDADPKKKH